MAKYIAIKDQLPPEGKFLNTKVCDEFGSRNFQRLRRHGGLWFTQDGTYVYYTPTHWMDTELFLPEKELKQWDKHYFNWG